MKERLKQIINTKEFHICVLAFIIILILFIAGVISIKYSVEGEKNLPFYLKKVSVISYVEGTENQDNDNKWNKSPNLNNDIYLYIAKNENYLGTEIIQSVIVENFQIIKDSKIGTKKIYKPDGLVENRLFENTEENEVQKIQYNGALQTDIKKLQISNQGDKVIFRYAIKDIGQYISNEDEEIEHSELLKKININNDDLKITIAFDIIINLESNKVYKSNIQLELPVGNIVENGTQGIDITDLDNVIFKRSTVQ